MLTLQVLGLGLVVLVVLSILWSTLETGISPMPSSPASRKALYGLLPSDCTGQVIELGSGWGGMAIDLARRYPDAHVVGYELSLLPLWVSRLARWRPGCENLHFVRVDFLEAPLHEADVLVCYLHPGSMKRLAPRLARTLKPGAILVSHTFRLPGWTPERTVDLSDLYRTRIYRYIQGSTQGLPG